ncbi:hypothetical protein MLD38_028536 [Melastoma candidum]|uniref:Uncharacterized protein n=1 Tax=Melastoma candidum TaxID=119954 RepID=A0ACB9N125_9MYRT|nr:hypothetical protein MLD38_028536 [Melastoma candidum]
MLVAVVAAAVSVLTVTCLWVTAEWVWLKPKRAERQLRRQGFSGNPYRLLSGDLKETESMLAEARSRPIGLDDDIMPRIVPFEHQTIKNYGKKTFTWVGPEPAVIVMDPDHIKEILSKMSDYPKPASNPLVKLLAQGVAAYEGDKWSVHRKILNPAFHLEKLKASLNFTAAWATLV